VKDDVHTNKQEDLLVSLRNKIMELRKQENFEEFDKGIDEIYRSLNKAPADFNEKMSAKKTPVPPIPASKIKYEKDDLISFHDLFLCRPIIKACNLLEYDHPTRIQSQVIPKIIENHDLLVNAVTGSGKTASYFLPILEKLHRRDMRTSKVSNVKLAKTRVIILLPTRELAAQCSSMLENLGKFVVPKITYCTVIGGSSIRKQEMELMERPDILISTPGRLLDIILNSKNIYFNSVEVVILDEADRLLEMGFQEVTEEILKNVKKDSDVENLQT
jgi:ATP-dependent RNA helicase DDX27